jgi:hypothetical protein
MWNHYQITSCHFSEGCDLSAYCRDNLKPHLYSAATGSFSHQKLQLCFQYPYRKLRSHAAFAEIRVLRMFTALLNRNRVEIFWSPRILTHQQRKGAPPDDRPFTNYDPHLSAKRRGKKKLERQNLRQEHVELYHDEHTSSFLCS